MHFLHESSLQEAVYKKQPPPPCRRSAQCKGNSPKEGESGGGVPGGVSGGALPPADSESMEEPMDQDFWTFKWLCNGYLPDVRQRNNPQKLFGRPV